MREKTGNLKFLYGLFCLFLFTILMGISGCKKSEKTPASEEVKSTAAETAEKRWTIGMSQCNLGEPWRVQMNLDIKNAAEEHPEIMD